MFLIIEPSIGRQIEQCSGTYAYKPNWKIYRFSCQMFIVCYVIRKRVFMRWGIPSMTSEYTGLYELVSGCTDDREQAYFMIIEMSMN